jgi:hypothetical protein
MMNCLGKIPDVIKPFDIRAADSYQVHLCDALPEAAVVRHAKQIPAEFV